MSCTRVTRVLVVLFLLGVGNVGAQEADPAPDRGGRMEEALLGLIVAGVAGLLGSGAGVYFHLRQKRQETTFDRQLMWCEKALAAFHETGAAVAAAEHASQADLPSAADCWAVVTDGYEKLIPIAGQRVLYATPEGDRAISQFMASLESLIEARLDDSVLDTRAHSDACLNRLGDAWMAMSVEARKHLNLDPLDADGPPRFTRSFRGTRVDHGS